MVPMEQSRAPSAPHALLIPFPVQGHIGPFMQFAHSLLHFSNNNITISFLNTDDNHQRLTQNTTSSPSSPIRFLTFSDGLPADHGRALKLREFDDALIKNGTPAIHKILNQQEETVSVIISDVWLSFTQEIADKHGIPRIAFRTGGACAFSLWHHLPPRSPSENGDDYWERWRSEMAKRVPVMDAIRVKDHPKASVVTNDPYFITQWPHLAIQNAKEHAAFILINSWEDLEEPLLEDLNEEFQGKILAVGPVLAAQQLKEENLMSGSLWKEEEECLKWLDRQKEKSVLYVSIGSIAVLSEEDIRKLALGLEGAGYPFLCVVREDMASGFGVREEVKERCGERACFVKWAPQRKVLSHVSVGGFLTHCGWSSVVEGLSSAVPMICMPFFGDQPCNRAFVCHVWRCGLELKDNVEREDVEAAVKRLMDVESADGMELRVNAQKIRRSLVAAVAQGESSQSDINKVIDFVKGY